MLYDSPPQDETCQIRFNRIVSILSAAILRLEAKSRESDKSIGICE